jgi:predicted AlkP superfamily pyrophosphatase or phosphodiesterase
MNSGLDERNLTDTVNVIIVSDHGMAEAKGLIQLENLVDVNLLHQVDGLRVLAALWPKDTQMTASIYEQMLTRVGEDQKCLRRMHGHRAALLWD